MNQEQKISRKSIAVIGIRGLPANYGGLETCAEEVTRRWVVAGHEVRVYCRKNRYRERPTEVNGVQLAYTGSINFKSLDTITHTFFSIVHLLFSGRQFRYVHLYNTGNSLFLPLLTLFGKRVILSSDGIEWRREKWGIRGAVLRSIPLDIRGDAGSVQGRWSLVLFGAKQSSESLERHV